MTVKQVDRPWQISTRYYLHLTSVPWHRRWLHTYSDCRKLWNSDDRVGWAFRFPIKICFRVFPCELYRIPEKCSVCGETTAFLVDNQGLGWPIVIIYHAVSIAVWKSALPVYVGQITPSRVSLFDGLRVRASSFMCNHFAILTVPFFNAWHPVVDIGSSRQGLLVQREFLRRLFAHCKSWHVNNLWRLPGWGFGDAARSCLRGRKTGVWHVTRGPHQPVSCHCSFQRMNQLTDFSTSKTWMRIKPLSSVASRLLVGANSIPAIIL